MRLSLSSVIIVLYCIVFDMIMIWYLIDSCVMMIHSDVLFVHDMSIIVLDGHEHEHVMEHESWMCIKERNDVM